MLCKGIRLPSSSLLALSVEEMPGNIHSSIPASLKRIFQTFLGNSVYFHKESTNFTILDVLFIDLCSREKSSTATCSPSNGFLSLLISK